MGKGGMQAGEDGVNDQGEIVRCGSIVFEGRKQNQGQKKRGANPNDKGDQMQPDNEVSKR